MRSNRDLGFGAVLALALFALGIGAGLLNLKANAQPGVAPNPDLLFACNQSVFYNGSSSGGVELVAGTASKQIYVCGYTLWADGTVTAGLVYGTGSTCGGGTTAITPGFVFAAQTGLVDHLPVYGGIAPVPVSNNLCLNISAGVGLQAVIYYVQF
jgi:hypothetical protein